MGTEAHSADLRSPVVAEVLSGRSRRQAAARFKVSASSAIRWVALQGETGGVNPRPRGGKSRSLGHVRQRGGKLCVVELAMDHAAMVAIWVGTASINGGMSSAIASVCM